MKKYSQNLKSLVLLYLSIILFASSILTPYSGFASPENKTLMQSQGIQGMTTTNATNIVLVHGAWADGSSWSKVTYFRERRTQSYRCSTSSPFSGRRRGTVKRAIDLVGGPITLVGHSYGGFVITNAAYNNPNVTGLVYVAAFAPDEGQSLSDFVDATKLPKDFLISDSGGFTYINPAMFPGAFAQDIDPTEADIMAIVQKPINQSISAEKSGPPAWKQLPTWFQISESDHLIPPDTERLFAKRMNATTISINSSHASLVSHPDQIAELILNATKGRTG